MRYILKLLQIIIYVYLLLFLLVQVFFISQKYLYNNEYPNIKGYSLYKVETNRLENRIDINSYVILHSQKEYKKDDIILYKGKNINIINDIKYDEENKKKMIVLLDENKDEIILNVESIYGKVIYNNNIIDIILNFLTHPRVVLLLFLSLVFLSSATYKRYNN